MDFAGKFEASVHWTAKLRDYSCTSEAIQRELMSKGVEMMLIPLALTISLGFTF